MRTALGISIASRRHTGRLLTIGILRAGVVAVILAILANLVVRWIGMAVITVSPEFRPLASPWPIIIFTAIGVGASVGIYWALTQRTAQPLRWFRWISAIALLLSIVPNIGLMIAPDGLEGSSAGAVMLLIMMHVVAASVSWRWPTTPLRTRPDAGVVRPPAATRCLSPAGGRRSPSELQPLSDSIEGLE